MPEYFVVRADGTKEGPYSPEQISIKVSAGDIRLEEFLEDAGSGHRVSAGNFVAGGEIPAPPEAVRKVNPLLWVVIAGAVVCVPSALILAAIVFPIFSQAKLAAKLASTRSDIKQFTNATLIYATDNDDLFPPLMATAQDAYPAVQSYFKRDLPRSLNPNGADINGNRNLNGVMTTSVKNADRTMMYFDSASWPNGARIVSFVDGSSKRVEERDFLAGQANRYVMRP